jgi:hypothetical protein
MIYLNCGGYMVVQQVEAQSTSLKVAGSDPDEVIGLFN